MKRDNMQLDTNRIIGFYAPQNYGKTYMMSKLVMQIAEHIPVFVYDTNFERLTAYPQAHKNISFVKAKNIVNQEKPEFRNRLKLQWFEFPALEQKAASHSRFVPPRGRSPQVSIRCLSN